MEIARSLEALRGAEKSYVTIGNFDGMHAGHRELVECMIRAARRDGAKAVVVTFDPHPRERFSEDGQFRRLSSEEEKLAQLRKMGVDMALIIPFTPEFAAMPPEEFVRTVLVEKLHAVRVFVGHDWRFGSGRGGDFSLARDLGARYGFTVDKVAPVCVAGEAASSSRVRAALEGGDMGEASALLGGFFTVSGEVVKGFQRGRQIGFPTANILPGNTLLPKTGGYLTWAEVDGKRYMAMTNIGRNPTFGNDHVTVETHLLDFSGDLYGKTLTLHFVDFLEPEQKYESVEALKAHLAEIERKVRERLGEENF